MNNIKKQKESISLSLNWRSYNNLIQSIQESQLAEICKIFPFKITPYYYSLIDSGNPNDPLLKMTLPDLQEMKYKHGEMDDPIGDLKHQPVKGIVHRYPDRVLFSPTLECGGHCRYCFRRVRIGSERPSLTQPQLKTALDYVQNNRDIHEVILTGGDPLMLGDQALKEILQTLKKQPHIKTIRIHTKMPVWNPSRITDTLADILSDNQPLYLVTHFNHPREVTELAVEKLSKLISNGIPLLNQSVLLKGVNDSTEVQKKLLLSLIRARIKPYYLHQLDRVKGASHFRVPVRKGLKILRQLRGTLPGYAIPHYIWDIPGGYGKIPLQNNSRFLWLYKNLKTGRKIK